MLINLPNSRNALNIVIKHEFHQLNVNEVLLTTAEIRTVYLMFMYYAKSCNSFNCKIILNQAQQSNILFIKLHVTNDQKSTTINIHYPNTRKAQTESTHAKCKERQHIHKQSPTY